jgi:glycerate kinase
MSACVTGPLGVPVDACWGLSGDGQTAFIEMAAASGLGLVPPAQRNPLLTTSRGTGELILQALEHGAKISLLVLAAVQPTTVAQGWCRRWARGFATRTA